jgi:hypothetical protein
MESLVVENIVLLSSTTLRTCKAKKIYDKIVSMYNTYGGQSTSIIMNEFRKLYKLGYSVRLRN